MRKSWVVCALMSALLGTSIGTLAWGQAQPGTPAPANPGQSNPNQSMPGMAMPGKADDDKKPAAEVPLNAVVLTIKGVCPATGAATAKTPATAGKTAAATSAAKKPADCKTEMTRAQFEKIAGGLSSNVTPQLKRQLEQALPRFMAMSDIAKKKGLENSERYKETLRVAKMQILTTELQRQAQEEAEKVTPAEMEKYYKDNEQTFEQFSLDRLFVSRYKQVQPEEKDEKEGEKLTEEQQKAKDAAEKAKQEKGEQELNQLADTLRERAAKGEDFATLQKEAYEAAGQKVETPNVNLPKVRRTGLPPAHAEVFELKVGEVSKVITDNGGHYIYKVVSKEVLPMDQVKDEIHNKLKSERLKKIMDGYTASFTAVPNEEYFGAAPAPGGPGGRPGPGMRPGRMPMPPQGGPAGAPPAGAPPQGQTPPPAAPPTQPN